MKVSSEMLMAYVDGELDDAGVVTVEQAMREDADTAAAVARTRALRERIFKASLARGGSGGEFDNRAKTIVEAMLHVGDEQSA